MSYIDKSIDLSKYHIFKKDKSLLSDTSIIKLKKQVKENVSPPTKNTKIYMPKSFSTCSCNKVKFAIIISKSSSLSQSDIFSFLCFMALMIR